MIRHYTRTPISELQKIKDQSLFDPFVPFSVKRFQRSKIEIPALKSGAFRDSLFIPSERLQYEWSNDQRSTSSEIRSCGRWPTGYSRTTLALRTLSLLR